MRVTARLSCIEDCSFEARSCELATCNLSRHTHNPPYVVLLLLMQAYCLNKAFGYITMGRLAYFDVSMLLYIKHIIQLAV